MLIFLLFLVSVLLLKGQPVAQDDGAGTVGKQRRSYPDFLIVVYALELAAQQADALVGAEGLGVQGLRDARRERLARRATQVERVTGSGDERGRLAIDALAEVVEAADRRGLGVLCAGTHPITDWQTQDISPKERYAELVEKMQWLARRLQIFGVHVHVATPRGFELPDEVVDQAGEVSQHGAGLTEFTDPKAAVRDVDAIYTDVWTSMGQEAEASERQAIFAPYQVNGGLMSHSAGDAIFMHCLPAHRGDEVTDEVIDSAASVVFDQSENRLHTQKALLAMLA